MALMKCKHISPFQFPLSSSLDEEPTIPPAICTAAISFLHPGIIQYIYMNDRGYEFSNVVVIARSNNGSCRRLSFLISIDILLPQKNFFSLLFAKLAWWSGEIGSISLVRCQQETLRKFTVKVATYFDSSLSEAESLSAQPPRSLPAPPTPPV